MKLLVHDYAGHTFQPQLSRELARRGHVVEHVQCGSYVSGKGHVESDDSDPESLTFTALALAQSFDKYTTRRRLNQEWSYARLFNAHVAATRPDLVLMCNVPLAAHWLIDRRLRALKIPTLFWHQDVYSHAIALEARRKLGVAGVAVGLLADRLERTIARHAESVVGISEHFLGVYSRWGTDPRKVHVIPNWGPAAEVTPRPRDNEWARIHNLVGKPVLLYSGTLGLKHDPDHLVSLLRGVRSRTPDAQLVVVSDGPAAYRLRERAEPGLTVLPFQPFERLSDVLSSADILIAILTPEASRYSVPSKALTYLCAGRPVLGLLPTANPVSDVIRESGGIAVDLAESEITEAVAGVVALLSDPDALVDRGRRARDWAERNFDIVKIGNRFEAILSGAPAPTGLAAAATEQPDLPGVEPSGVTHA